MFNAYFVYMNHRSTVSISRDHNTKPHSNVSVSLLLTCVTMALSKEISDTIVYPSISAEPHQPTRFKFPKREFGKKSVVKRSFQVEWFKKWPWLHYREDDDTVFCHTCVKAFKELNMRIRNAEDAFISRGFSNWKLATSVFRQHEVTNCHKEAVEKIVTLPATTSDIGEMLCKAHSQEKYENRPVLLKILSNLRFLARQACAIRGDGDEADSNFMQLFKLRGEDNPKIYEWMLKRTDKYTSHDMQNDMLKAMAQMVLIKITYKLHNATFFSIMADETTDGSNREQVVIVLRYVDDSDFSVHEEFIGLYSVPSIDSDTLVSILKDTLLRLNLPLSKVRGQCYDGASNMSGIKNGVATQICKEEPRAVYTHCYGHSLNLAAADAIKKSKVIKFALATTHEVTKLIKYSPRRDSLFQNLKSELSPDTPGILVLCPTRWTVRANSLASILSNYTVLQELWNELCDIVKDTETIARINGVASQMKSFDFFLV